MRPVFIILPLVLLLVLFILLFSVSTPLVKAEELCKEGDRRVCGLDVGACKDIKPVCKNGTWTGCEGGAGPKESDICGSGVGICRSGRSVCKNGTWTECQGDVEPKEIEICGNGLDDDCDGAIDEDCFPWVSFVLVGIGMFFIGIGMYYMQHEKSEGLPREGVSKD